MRLSRKMRFADTDSNIFINFYECYKIIETNYSKKNTLIKRIFESTLFFIFKKNRLHY
jgi:hypothetical protein